MTLGIVLPVVLLLTALVAVGTWYRRTIRHPSPHDAPALSGTRLTAESLHRMPSPPWRIVHEITGRLEGVDHVVVGPPGIVAVTTRTADRPAIDQLDTRTGVPMAVAGSAVIRGRVDAVLPAGMTCDLLAHVYWGAADPRRAAGEPSVHGTEFVEGQRLHEWLADRAARAPAALTPEQVDRAWQAVTTGIGRPDPLA